MLCKISHDVRKNTDRCGSNFQCLTDNNFVMCPIEKELVEGALVIKRMKWPFSCKYSLNLRDKFVCTCPTRYYLYTNHGL
jgi:hypothetical protein